MGAASRSSSPAGPTAGAKALTDLPSMTYVTTLTGWVHSYHNHKEQMAYAFFGLQNAIFAFVLLSDHWPLVWLPVWVSMTASAVIALLVHLLLVNQIWNKQIAAYWVLLTGAILNAHASKITPCPAADVPPHTPPHWARRYLIPRIRPLDGLHTSRVPDAYKAFAATVRMHGYKSNVDDLLPAISLTLILLIPAATLVRASVASPEPSPPVEIIVRMGGS